MEYTRFVGIIAGILTSIALLPQLIKIIKEKNVEDLSISTFVTLTIGLSLWAYYGILQKDMPILVTNAFSVLINAWIIVLRFKYRNHP